MPLRPSDRGEKKQAGAFDKMATYDNVDKVDSVIRLEADFLNKRLLDSELNPVRSRDRFCEMRIVIKI